MYTLIHIPENYQVVEHLCIQAKRCFSRSDYDTQYLAI